MRRAAWTMRLSEPAARFIAVAAAVALLILLQLALLVGGGVSANRASDKAIANTFAYVADISAERVSGFARAAEEAVRHEVPNFLGARSSIAAINGFYDTMVTRPELATLSVTYPDGDYIALSRSRQHDDGYSAHVIDVRDSGVVAHRFAEYDDELRLISEHHNIVEWDPRDASPYEAALASRDLVWTRPYLDARSGEPQVAVVQAARDGAGQPHAVLSATIYLDQLAQVLNALPEGTDGEVFLLGPDRRLITVSEERRAAFDEYTAANDKLPRLTEIGLGSAVSVSTRGADMMGELAGEVTLERGLDRYGVPWVVHLRASEGGLNEGYVAVRNTMRWVIGSTILSTAVMGYLLAVSWRPVLNAHRSSVRDPLTGLYNRRYADRKSGRMLAATRSRDVRLVMAMFDLDNFKGLNDEMGHGAGDQALAEISSVLTAEIRSSDMAVRWGGDEFLVALMVPAQDDAGAMVERIRTRVEATLQGSFGAERGLGVTAGYCVSDQTDAEADALISAADAALVDGKAVEKGRTYEGFLAAERTISTDDSVASAH